MSAEVAIASLTTAEVSQLAECEAVIERGRKTFVEVGAALATVRDGRLWRDGFASFEDYCEERWGFRKTYAYDMITSAQAAIRVSAIAEIPPPANEAQARELAKAAPEDQLEVWGESVARAGGEAPPARVVAQVVAERQAPAAAMASAPPVAEAVIRDAAPARDGDEWYTRADHLALVREVLGGIDLDPASCEVANATVQAERYFAIEDDGLAQDWEAARVFMNPPYSETGDWIDKLVASYTAGAVTEAITLVNAKTDTAWFEWLWDHALICFVRGRVSFTAGDGGKSQTGYSASVFAYFGHRPEVFAAVFGKVGRIVRAERAA